MNSKYATDSRQGYHRPASRQASLRRKLPVELTVPDAAADARP
jgi:hypothetical protein